MKKTLSPYAFLALLASLGAYGCSSTDGNDAGAGVPDATSPSDARGGDGEAAGDATSPSHDAQTGPAEAGDETLADNATRDADAQTQDGAPGVDSSNVDAGAADREASADALVFDATDAAVNADANDAGRAPDVADAASAPDVTDAPSASDVTDAATAPGADASALGPVGTGAVLLAAGGDACLTCAEKASKCIAQSGSCEDLAGLTATGGARNGAPRTDLCLETLSCVLRSQCTNLDTGTDFGCYCGSACNGAGLPNGPCLAQELAGTETNDAGDLANLLNYYDTVRGAGRANGLVACLATAGCVSCFAPVATDR